MNRERIVELIEHYKTVPELRGWGWADCAMAVAFKKGWATEHSPGALAEALGISYSDAWRLIYMADDNDMGHAAVAHVTRFRRMGILREVVVATLQRYLVSSSIHWGLEDAH